MPRKETYLLRDALGRMHTEQAFSHRGALRQFLVRNRTKSGDVVEVKRRGYAEGDWQAFKLS